jgi:predicted ATPase
MSHLLKVGLKNSPQGSEASRFPFSVPAVRTLPTLDLGTQVTMFVGENGSGKSTLLEGLAAAAELRSFGASSIAADDTLTPQRALGASLRLSWSRRSRKGFFLRAEDFFGYLKEQARTDARIAREWLESPGEEPALDSNARHVDERNAARYLAQHDARSHGESFIDLFAKRFESNGLYLLDEPEAPLSPMRQLTLLSLIMEFARRDAQFVIATHSPILLACPEARIYSFDRTPIAEVSYRELEHVNVMRDFLNNPEQYLRRLV